MFTNPEGLSLTDVWAPAFDAAGMTSLMYVPPHTPMRRTEWPTLGQMIDSGKRVVFFMDYDDDGSVNYILPEFQMVRTFIYLSSYGTHCRANGVFLSATRSGSRRLIRQTTPSRVRSIASLVRSRLRTTCTCSTISWISTCSALASSSVTPARLPRRTVLLRAYSPCKALSSVLLICCTLFRILADADGCRPLSGGSFNPSFVLMDFVNLGNGFAAVDKMNGF